MDVSSWAFGLPAAADAPLCAQRPFATWRTGCECEWYCFDWPTSWPRRKQQQRRTTDSMGVIPCGCRNLKNGMWIRMILLRLANKLATQKTTTAKKNWFHGGDSMWLSQPEERDANTNDTASIGQQAGHAENNNSEEKHHPCGCRNLKNGITGCDYEWYRLANKLATQKTTTAKNNWFHVAVATWRTEWEYECTASIGQQAGHDKKKNSEEQLILWGCR